MKNTITTNSQAFANYIIAADRIMNFMDDLGFTSDSRQDPDMIRHTVAALIRDTVEGNVNYSYDMGGSAETDTEECIPTLFDPPECGCGCECSQEGTQEDIEAIIRELEEENIHHGCPCCEDTSLEKILEEKRKNDCPCGCKNERQPGE